jgi:hypothetical protein
MSLATQRVLRPSEFAATYNKIMNCVLHTFRV